MNCPRVSDKPEKNCFEVTTTTTTNNLEWVTGQTRNILSLIIIIAFKALYIPHYYRAQCASQTFTNTGHGECFVKRAAASLNTPTFLPYPAPINPRENKQTNKQTSTKYYGIMKMRITKLMMSWWSTLAWDYWTETLTTLTLAIIKGFSRPGDCGTCCVGQVTGATTSKTHPWSGWS